MSDDRPTRADMIMPGPDDGAELRELRAFSPDGQWRADYR